MAHWNLAQRLAVLLALGVVLHVSSQVILFENPTGGGGWFNYAPNAQAVHVPGVSGTRFSPLAQLLVITAHVAVWAVAAVWILSDRDDPKDG